MKRQDIEARTVLAWRRGARGAVRPVAVIDTFTLWSRSINRMTQAVLFEPAEGWTCSTENYYGRHTTGYLTASTGHTGTPTEHLDELCEWVAGLPEQLDEMVVNALANDMPKGLYLDVENNRNLVGVWEQVKADAEARDQERRRQREREREQQAREIALEKAIRDAIAARGLLRGAVHFTSTSNNRLSVPVTVMADLLGIDPDQVEADRIARREQETA